MMGAMGQLSFTAGDVNNVKGIHIAYGVPSILI